MTIRSAAVAVAALAVVAAFLVPYESPSGDAFEHAILIRDRDTARIQPNHLLLEPTVRAIHVAASRFGDIEPLDTLLWVSRIALVVWALLVLRIGSLLFGGVWLPFATAAGCTASLACLWFGTDGEPILLAHLPLLLGAAVHLRALQRRSAMLLAAAGVAYGVSILFYVTNAALVAVLGVAAVGGLLVRRRARALIVPAIGVLVAGLGVVVVHAATGSSLPVHRWVLAYGGGASNVTYGGVSLISLFRVVFGLGGSLVGTPGAARLVRRWTEGEESIEPQPLDGVDFAVWSVAVVAAGALTVRAGAWLPRLEGSQRAALAVCLASAALLASFNFLWIGSDPQFWVPVLPLLWIAWGLALGRSRRAAVPAAMIAVGFLLPYNVFGTLHRFRGDREPSLQRAELMRLAPEPCFLVTPGLDWMDGYCRYHGLGDRRVLSLWELSVRPEFAGELDGYLAELRSAIDGALGAGRPVFVHGVLDERFPRGVPWRDMGPRGFPLERIQATLAEYPSRPGFSVRGREFVELTRRAARS
jgi:hypothetical protein